MRKAIRKITQVPHMDKLLRARSVSDGWCATRR